MIGLIFFGIAALASAVIGGIYYATQDLKEREVKRTAVFSRIREYGEEM